MLPSNRGPVKLAATRAAAPAELIGRLPAAIATTLASATMIAASCGAQLWLVGGAVRDLLREADLDRDIDLAVEGDAVALADRLAAGLGGQIRASHQEFGTAALALPGADFPLGELNLDLARARVETYPQPATLPLVRPASIGEDLGRRDFSVNAIALQLHVADGQLRAGALLDPFAGRADLAAGRLRLLHPLSLRDDPTRILRGLRLAARLGLTPDAASAEQIAAALDHGYLGMLTPERALGELCLALAEPQPAATLALADAWGVSPQIAPGLAWSAALEARFGRWQVAGGRWQETAPTPGALSPQSLPPATYLPHPTLLAAGLLCYDLQADELGAIARRYPLPTPFARLLAEIPAARAAAQLIEADVRPSQIDLLLRPYSEVAISMLHYAETGFRSQAAARYLSAIRPARPPLDGRDLQRLGVAPGPAIGRLLAGLRAAHLDGEIQSPDQAERWVREQLS